ncbi:serine/threonine-protein kinase, partial [Nocardioides sp.]|uniref:serine/threonine-protein kinase n=1 Tax=Nocardioides sp. TaxID=35761 RepID=UPI00271C2E5E
MSLTYGRYRVEHQIGQGGMGVVHLATDTVLQRPVALKVVTAVLADSDEFRARFAHEAEALARLDSPHIIQIFDHGEQDGVPYIATQYVAGGDLGGLLAERGPLPSAMAASVCAQVADALHDAHRIGIVHRDVKATNVLVRDPAAADLHVYLCDFGIAKSDDSDGMTRPGGVAGTWAYLSPERADGSPATPASDVYAAGCLLWTCLTGAPPFGGTEAQVVLAHQNAPVPQLADGGDPATAMINRVLARALAKDPAARYADAAELRGDLTAAARTGSSTAAVPAAAPETAVAPSATR